MADGSPQACWRDNLDKFHVWPLWIPPKKPALEDRSGQHELPARVRTLMHPEGAKYGVLNQELSRENESSADLPHVMLAIPAEHSAKIGKTSAKRTPSGPAQTLPGNVLTNFWLFESLVLAWHASIRNPGDSPSR